MILIMIMLMMILVILVKVIVMQLTMMITTIHHSPPNRMRGQGTLRRRGRREPVA